MFDRYVQGTKPSWKRRAVLTVSLALHAIAAIVLVVYSFIHVEEITPPALSLTFFSAPPPPPPPPPPAAHKKVEHTSRRRSSRRRRCRSSCSRSRKKRSPTRTTAKRAASRAASLVASTAAPSVASSVAPAPRRRPSRRTFRRKFERRRLSGDDAAPAGHRQDSAQGHRRGDLHGQDLHRPERPREPGQRSCREFPAPTTRSCRRMRSWKYKPQPFPICSMIRLVYTIN